MGEFVAKFGRRTNQPIPTTQSPVEEPRPIEEPVKAVAAPVFKPLRLPESAQKPYTFLVAIADDYYSDRILSQRGVEASLALTNPNSGVIAPDTAIAFFNTAMRGKQGEQADVAFLDDNYGSDAKRWHPEPEKIIHLAQTLGIDFARFTPEKVQRRDRSFYYRLEGMDNFYYAGSVNYSLILRALGFMGSIFVVSSDPPPARQFMEAAEKIRTAIPTFYPESPINGMIHKETFSGMNSLIYATEARTDGSWDTKRIVGDPRASVNLLLRVGNEGLEPPTSSV